MEHNVAGILKAIDEAPKTKYWGIGSGLSRIETYLPKGSYVEVGEAALYAMIPYHPVMFPFVLVTESFNAESLSLLTDGTGPHILEVAELPLDVINQAKDLKDDAWCELVFTVLRRYGTWDYEDAIQALKGSK